MSKTYLSYEPDQQLLLPAALQEWLPDDHLAYFISDVVDQLDMSEVTARYERERRGGPPYHPRMMVKVLLYGYCVGVASSRRIAQRLHEDIAFSVLAANNTPDFRTMSDFRKDHVDALSGLFVQVLALCQQAGLVKLGHVALDGTKVKANASKHKAMSYQRMKEKAAQLAAEVAELLRQAQAADDEEDRRYGEDKRGDELPQELAFREGRLEKIREAMAALEAEAQAAAEQAEAEGGKRPGVPDDKAQRNFTDTESRIIPAPGGKDFLQAYNCQAVVDSAHQVIVAARATNQTSDKQQAAAMMEETIDNVGAVPREVSADAGHWLVVQLDVARWKEDKCLMPDVSSPNMLQDVLNQVVWLSPGKPCSMEWRPYKDIWHRYEHDVPPDRDAASREAAARWLPIQLSTVTVHLGWYEEHGWELHQNGGALREYRIRQPDGGGFQAFHNHFDRGSLGPPVYSRHHKNRILEGMEQEDIWAGPVRTSWKDAVKDLFGYRAPGVEPIF